jgi:hypothetical protein
MDDLRLDAFAVLRVRYGRGAGVLFDAHANVGFGGVKKVRTLSGF